MFSYFFSDKNDKNDNDNNNNNDKNIDNDISDISDISDNKILFLNDIDDTIDEVIIDVDENNLLLVDEKVISYGDLNNSNDNIIIMTPSEKENSLSLQNDNKDDKNTHIPRPTLVAPDNSNNSLVNDDITVETDSGSDAELDIFVGSSTSAVMDQNTIATSINETENDETFLIDKKYPYFTKNKTLFVGAFCCGATVFFYFSVNGFHA